MTKYCRCIIVFLYADSSASPPLFVRGIQFLHHSTGGIRKIALDGIRAICYYHADPAAVYLLTAYAKADREDMKPADKKAWSRLVAEIKKEEAK